MPSYPSELLLAVLAVGIRTFLSTGEVALVRASRRKVRDLQKRRRRLSSRALASLLQDPDGAFASNRIGSMASLSVAAALGGLGFIRLGAGTSWPSPLLLLVGALLAAVLSFLVEIIPRSLAAASPERWGLRLAPFLWIWKEAFTPAVRGVGRLLSLVGIRVWFRPPSPAMEEMKRILVEEGSDRGGPAPELLQSLFELPYLLTKDVLIPRTEVVAIPSHISPAELVRLVAEAGHSRFPVYEGAIDKIVGVLHTRDIVPLFAHPELIHVTDLVRPPRFVPWALRLDKLLRQMQEEQIHLVMVTDEHGGFRGIVTLEDVLSKVMGGLRDPPALRYAAPQEDGSFHLDASTPLSRANALLSADLPEGEGFGTLGGFLNHLARTVPEEGAVLESNGMLFTVLERTATKVVRVQVRPNPDAGVGAA